MKQIINSKVYSTATAEEIASDNYSDSSNRLNRGRGTTLYKTKKGAFFALHETCWQGEHDKIEPLTIPQAKEYFEELSGDPDSWPEEFGAPEEA